MENKYDIAKSETVMKPQEHKELESQIYDAKVEQDVYRCIELLADSLGYALPKERYPKISISESMPSSCYNVKTNHITIKASHIGDGWAYAEEAAHALRELIHPHEDDELISEFYGRLGAKLIQKFSADAGLEGLFNRKPSDTEALMKSAEDLVETNEAFEAYPALCRDYAGRLYEAALAACKQAENSNESLNAIFEQKLSPLINSAGKAAPTIVKPYQQLVSDLIPYLEKEGAQLSKKEQLSYCNEYVELTKQQADENLNEDSTLEMLEEATGRVLAHAVGYSAADEISLDDVIAKHRDIFTWPTTQTENYIRGELENGT